MSEIKLSRDKSPVVVHKIPWIVSVRRIFCRFEIFLGDVAFSSSIERYSRLEDFFCSGRRREVQLNVTIQQIMAGLDLSRLGVEFLACSKVSLFRGRESFSQIGSMVM